MQLGRKMIALITVFMMVFGSLPLTGLADAAHPYYYSGDLSYGGSVHDSSGSEHETALITLRKDNSSDTVQTYCVDLHHWLQKEHFSTAPLTDDHIRAILYANVDSIISGLGLSLTGNQKTEAIQAAIWHFSDSMDLGSNNDAGVIALYNALIALPAKGPVGTETPATVSAELVSFDSINGSGRVTMTFRYQCSDSGVTLHPAVSGGNGTLGTPQLNSGWYYVSVSNVDPASAFTFSVSGTQSIHYDAVKYIPENSNDQKLVGLPHSESASVSASVPVQFGSIRVRKVFDGSANNAENFTVTITGTGALAGKVSRTITVNSNATNDNWIAVSGLPFGTYTVAETLTSGQQALYQIVSVVNDKTGDNTVTVGDGSSGDGVTIECEPSYDGNVTVTNRKIGSLDLKKHVDTTTSAGNASFHFTVTGPGGYSKTVDLTDGADQALGGLVYGDYKITESATDNFRLTGFTGGGGNANSDGSYTVTVGDSNRSVSVTANNQMLGRIVINKVDSKTGNPVSGVTFHIAGPDFTGDKTTGSSGQIVIDHLTPGGSYTVTEVSAPADYNMDGGSHPAQTIPAGGTATFSFSDTPTGIIKVIKQDAADSSVKLSGVTFKVSKSQTDFSDANVVATLVTGSDGTDTSGKIPTGTYWIKEMNPPDGYVNDNGTAKQITIVQSKSAVAANTFTFSDRKYVGSLLIKKTSAYDGSPVAGAQFQVSKNDAFTDLVTLPNGGKTDANGQLLVNNLLPGPYWVRETAPAPGYSIDTTVVRNVTVVFDAPPAEADFTNTPVGTVKIIKKDGFDNSALAGAVFGVYSDAACTALVDTLAATDANGLALSDPLPFVASTAYYVKEITPPARYIADTSVQKVTFTAPSQVVELTFTNQRNFGDLKVKKVLEGDAGDTTSFTFKITGPSYPDGHTFQLAPNEETPFHGLTFGTYVITELSVPSGYKLESMTGGNGTWDGTSYTVALNGSNQGFTVTADNRKLGSIDIKKALLDGVTGDATKFDFTISGPGFSSPQGFSIASGSDKPFAGLEYGQYVITELPCPDGYAFASFSGGGGTADGRTWTVTLGASNLNITVTCSNHKLGHLKVIKTKNGSQPVAYLAGAIFGIYSDQACAHLVETMQATGADGKAESGWLVPGAYWVKEISAPTGYGIDSAVPVQATVAPGEIYILPVFTDTQLLGRAKFSKVVDDDSSDTAKFILHVTGDNGYSHDVTVGQSLAPETLSDLPFGHYTVTEDAVTGYQKMGITNEGKFTIDASNYSGPAIQVVATNHKLLGKATFSKVVNNVKDDPATFTLHVTCQDNGYSKDVTVGETLDAKILNDLPFGTYTVTEVDKDGYQKVGITNDGKFTIDDTNYNGPAIAVVATNHKLFGSVKLNKDVNNIDDDPTHFTLHVVSLDGHYSHDVTVVDGQPAQTLSDLPFGHYTVTEDAVTGYQTVGISIDGNLTDDGAFTIDSTSYQTAITATAVNHKLLGTVIFSKVVDNIDNDPTEFKLKITGDNGYSNSVKVTETGDPVTLDGLPFGHYTVTEDAVTGYHTVSITNDGKFTIDASNYNKTAIQVVATNHKLLGKATLSKVVDNVDNDPATFTLHVTGPEGYSRDVTVGETLDAKALNDLPFGSYTVTEADADGYQKMGISVNGGTPTDKAAFTIDESNYAGDAILVVATNRKLYGSAIFKKDVDNVDNDPATFMLHVTGPEGFKADFPVGEQLDPVTLDKLPFGQYTVSEDKVDGYQTLNIVNGSFTIDDTTYKTAITVKAENHKLLGKIKIVKTDAAQPSLYLKGAEFKISSSDTDFDAHVVETITTDGNGVAVSDPLPLGTYWVKETKAPYGYAAAGSDAVQVDVGATDTVYTQNFQDNKLYGSATFYKVIDNNDKDPQTFMLHVSGPNGYSHDVTVGQTKTPETLTGLEFGKYTVDEVTLDGYQTVKIDNGTFTIDDTTYQTAVAVTAHNCELFGSASFVKSVDNVDKDTTEFTLHVTGPNGYKADVTVGDTIPAKVLDDLPFGHYTVDEDAKDGYKLDSITPKEFDMNADNYTSVTAVEVVNSKLFGQASFVKSVDNVDKDTTEFMLHVTGPNGYKADVTVGDTIPAKVLNDLPFGHYTVTEDAADGYKLDGITPSEFDVTADNYTSVTAVEIVNSKLFGKASFSKKVDNVDKDTTEFTLRVTGPNGYEADFPVGEMLADHVLDNLPFGHYTVSEDAKDGYKLDSITPKEFDVNADNYTSVTAVKAVNSKLFGSASFSKKVDNVDNDATEFTLRVTGPNGYEADFPVGEMLADHVLDNLPFGHYTVSEDAKDGYKLDSITPKEFDVNADNYTGVTAVKAVNSKLFGSAMFYKIIDNASNDPTAFTLHVTSDTGYSNSVTVGQIFAPAFLNDLPFGHYTVKEDAHDGYTTVSILNEHFTIDASSYGTQVQVEATNHKLLGRLQVVKKDSNNPALYLGGAEFAISTSGGSDFGSHIKDTMTTDGTTGIATSSLLPVGTYWVKETKAPNGYVIDNADAVQAQVTADGETYQLPVFTDTKYEGALRIKKVTTYDHKTPVAGVQFQVATDEAFVHLLSLPNDGKTDPNGELLVQHLVPGTTYYVREINPAPGYDIDRSLVQHAAVVFNAIVDVNFENTPVGHVQLTKSDAGNPSRKLAGAVFGIYKDSACTDLADLLPATDESGVALSGDLPFGPSTVYYVKEITAPAGYVLNTEVKQAAFTTPGQVLAMTFTDVQNVGSIIIKKVNELNPNQTLAGAEFTLYSDEACTHQLGQPVTTGADGIARFDNLTPGTYYLKETKAPKDYKVAVDSFYAIVTAGVTQPDPIVIKDTYNPPHGYQTGMMDWNVLIIGGLALVSGLLAVLFTRRKRAAGKHAR